MRSVCHEVGSMRGFHDHKVRGPEEMRCSVLLCGRALCDLTALMVRDASGTMYLQKALIAACMQLNALRARPRRRQLPNDQGERSIIAPNVLEREFDAPGPNQKWVADFTYIWTAQGWLYVAVVIDLFSRRGAARCRLVDEECHDTADGN